MWQHVIVFGGFATQRRGERQQSENAAMPNPTRKRAPGGGRKPLAPGGLTSVSVTLSADDLAFLRTIDENISAAIRTIVKERKMITVDLAREASVMLSGIDATKETAGFMRVLHEYKDAGGQLIVSESDASGQIRSFFEGKVYAPERETGKHLGTFYEIHRSCYPYTWSYEFTWKGQDISGHGFPDYAEADIAARSHIESLQ